MIGPGDVLFRRENINVILVTRLTRDPDGTPVAHVFYLDNVNPAFVGSTYELEADYVAKHYRAGPR